MTGFTYHLTSEDTPSDVSATDLRQEAEKLIAAREDVKIFGLEERYNGKHNACGSLLFVPGADRVGWALNGEANWMDATSPEHAIERLNDAEDNGE